MTRRLPVRTRERVVVTTEGITHNGKLGPETEEGKKSTATYFAMRYNAFHAVEDQLILKSPNQN